MSGDPNQSSAFWSWYPAWREQFEVRFGVKRLQQPTTEPISMADAALHLRLDTFGSPAEYPDQLLVQAQISAAREVCETYIGRSLAPQLFQWAAPYFPATDYIELPFGPLLGVNSVSYWDGISQIELGSDEFFADTFTEPARVYLATSGGSWPTTTRRPGAARVIYSAGYAIPGESPDTEPLPWQIRAAMLLVLGNLYENRETVVIGTITSEITLTIKSLLDPYRLRTGFA